MNNRNREDLLIKLGLFLFNPIFGFLVSLKKLNSKSSYVIFFLFTIIFGISFTVPSGKTPEFTADGASYRIKFERIAIYNDNEFDKAYNDYTEFDEGQKDFYMTAVSFLVSRFTKNYHWVFGVYALVFGFFMLKSFRFLTNEKNFNNTLFCILLAIIFIMSNSIFNINGVRFWTASWIGVYCIFQIFQKNDKRYFILAAITPFIHLSYFVYFFVIIVTYFLKRPIHIWFVLFLISFFISNLFKLLLTQIEGFLPPFISRTIALYTDQQVIAAKEENTLWIAEVFNYLEIIVVNITVYFFYKNRLRIKQNPEVYNLFLFLVVWMTFVNFSSAIPALGSRFMHLSLPIIAYIWLTSFYKKYINWLIIFIAAYSLDFLYQLRSILKVTEVEFYISSPLYLIYNYLINK